MTQKPLQRRGLGRGLGALIPTAPRPDPAPADRASAEGGDGVPAPGVDVMPEQRSHGESAPEDRAEQPAPAVEPTAADPTTSPRGGADEDVELDGDAAG